MTYSASLTATEIALNRGLVTIVDADDFDWLSRWKWQISTAGYARRNPEGAERHSGPNSILMHRVLLPPPSGLFVDHINGDKLDNRRANLRICDKRQNAWNTTSCRGASAFKGVSWCGMTGRWSAHIRADGKSVRLGRFLTEEEAARAYDAAAMRVQGEFARLNFPMQEAG